jgi:hypothetical protein
VPNAAADHALAKRFLEEAPQKWRQYEAELRGFEETGDYLAVDLIPKNSETGECFRCLLSADGERAVWETRPKEASKRTAVYGSNPKYDFELRKGPGPTGAFWIESVESRSQSVESIALRNARVNVAMIWHGGWLLEFLTILRSPDFLVKDAREVSRDEKRFVQVQFEYQLKNPGPRDKYLPKSYSGQFVRRKYNCWMTPASK